MKARAAHQKNKLAQKARAGKLSGYEWISFLRQFRKFVLEVPTHTISGDFYLSAFDSLYIFHKSMPHPKTPTQMGVEEVQIAEYIESCHVEPWKMYETPYRHYINREGELIDEFPDESTVDVL